MKLTPLIALVILFPCIFFFACSILDSTAPLIGTWLTTSSADVGGDAITTTKELTFAAGHAVSFSHVEANATDGTSESMEGAGTFSADGVNISIAVDFSTNEIDGAESILINGTYDIVGITLSIVSDAETTVYYRQ
jgi:hypothetical protein